MIIGVFCVPPPFALFKKIVIRDLRRRGRADRCPATCRRDRQEHRLLALDGARQITSAHEIVARKLSVREAERLVARTAEQSARAPSAPRGTPPKSRDVARLEEEIADLLTAAVEIRMKRRGQQGEVAIAFASLDELSGLIERLRGRSDA